MILCIDTTKGDDIVVVVKNSSGVVARKRIQAKYCQAEKLLLMIDKMLKQKNFNIQDIKKIEVENRSDKEKTSFTALRIGVVTANALGYALGAPVVGSQRMRINRSAESSAERFCRNVEECGFDIVEPVYSKEPNIT